MLLRYIYSDTAYPPPADFISCLFLPKSIPIFILGTKHRIFLPLTCYLASLTVSKPHD